MEQILSDHDAALAQAENSGQSEPQTEAALKEERRFMDSEKAKPGVRQLADGILMTELALGTGPKPDINGRVQVKYVGSLPDGTIFDQSQQPQWFRLDSVIAGWTTALVDMPVGAKWRLVIPSAQAYGAEGAGDLIDPLHPARVRDRTDRGLAVTSGYFIAPPGRTATESRQQKRVLEGTLFTSRKSIRPEPRP
jgi:FKBP-type peptidyl-prolyl cis-trans isomerase